MVDFVKCPNNGCDGVTYIVTFVVVVVVVVVAKLLVVIVSLNLKLHRVIFRLRSLLHYFVGPQSFRE